MQQLLITSSKKLGLNIDYTQAKLLLEYLTTLQQWNKVHNLCAKADDLYMLGHHLLDSMSVAAKIQCTNCTILDVGSGAGLPGIPLAIIVPTAKITLLDANSKKIIFLTHVVNKLKLSNVQLQLTRIENYNPIDKFDLILSRAFSDLRKFVELSSRLVKNNNSKIIAMKADPAEFVMGAKVFEDFTIADIKEVMVPLVTAKRSLVIVSK